MRECVFEEEVLAAALQSRWPERVSAELRQHVAVCAVCGDLAEAASGINELHDCNRGRITVPDAGRVWWMAQMRARREAIKTAGRPITAIQVAALGCAAGLTGACFGATSGWFQSGLRWLTANIAGLNVETVPALFVLAALGVLLVLPAVLYFALGRD